MTDLAKRLENIACTANSARSNDAVDALMIEASREIERLRAALAAIQQATLDPEVTSDTIWFSQIETLHDFCDATLHGSKS